MKRLLSRWYIRHFHLFQRWYWLGKIDAVPLADYRKLQDSCMRLCVEQWESAQPPTFEGISHHCDYAWNSPRIVVTTDYRKGIPCS